MRVGIIGAGAVGTGMGLLLKQRGYNLIGVASRTLVSARRAAARLECPVFELPQEVASRGDIIFITTADRAIKSVVTAIGRKNAFRPGQTVIHMSGSLTSGVLEPARKAGALTLSLHPLQSCANADQAVANFPGSIFSLEGEQQALTIGKRLVKELAGEYFIIKPENKSLYHAAACVASNYLVSLVDLSCQLMQIAGMELPMAMRALAPLINGTWGNIGQSGTPQALTGPISRGDIDTISEHLVAIRATAPQFEDVYRALGRYTVGVAIRKGTLDVHKAALMSRALAVSGNLSCEKEKNKN